jgi:hypothetical protein
VTESVLIDPAEPAANILFVTGFVCERTLRLTRKQVLARRVPMRTAA